MKEYILGKRVHPVHFGRLLEPVLFINRRWRFAYKLFTIRNTLKLKVHNVRNTPNLINIKKLRKPAILFVSALFILSLVLSATPATGVQAFTNSHHQKSSAPTPTPTPTPSPTATPTPPPTPTTTPTPTQTPNPHPNTNTNRFILILNGYFRLKLPNTKLRQHRNLHKHKQQHRIQPHDQPTNQRKHRLHCSRSLQRNSILGRRKHNDMGKRRKQHHIHLRTRSRTHCKQP